MLAIWLVTQTGTLFLYQGQEIGMINAPKEWGIEEYKDVEALNHYKEALRLSDNGKGPDPTREKRIFQGLQVMARDHSRLPFQWDATENAGFTTGRPWMRTHDLYKEINAESQVKDPDSVLSFYKQMIRLRREHKDVLVYGGFKLLEPENLSTFTFRKHYQDKTAFVILNFTPSSQPVPAEILGARPTLLTSSYSKTGPGVLQPYEGRVYIDY
jgi:alpha-glucosidase